MQCIASHTRSGGLAKIRLERYTEALRVWSDISSTYRSTETISHTVDAERLFSIKIVEFMKKKGYNEEAKYIETICNWRRASDEHGLSSLKRSKYNYCLLNMILDELMPWHRESYNFALLEVNKYVVIFLSDSSLI